MADLGLPRLQSADSHVHVSFAACMPRSPAISLGMFVIWRPLLQLFESVI